MKRTSMRKIREIIRLHFKCKIENISKIAQTVHISRPVVKDYIIAFRKTGLCYEDIADVSDDSLLELLTNQRKTNERYKILIGYFPYFITELKKTGVNLLVLWEEYKKQNEDHYSYTQFCYYFQVWRSSSHLTMHIEHKAGDKMFSDFTGKKLKITDWPSGKQTEVEVFIAVLGASQYTYVEAVETQKMKDWLQVNENAFHYFGGVTNAIVPDNLKSAVTKACKYEPDVNPQYSDFARYYNTVIMPTRVRKPKDKALVEGAVNIAYSWIFAAIRNQTFYTLAELNCAIRDQLKIYNNKPMQLSKKSRLDSFNEIEKSSLKPLPKDKFELKSFSRQKVHFNYHIYLKKFDRYFSVPYRYRNLKTDVFYTDNTVEIYHKNIRIAFHHIDYNKKYNTNDEHRHPKHKWIDDWSPERLINWAASYGTSVKELIEVILKRAEYPEQAFKVCLGILSLKKKYGTNRLNSACRHAVSYDLYSFKSLKNILKTDVDKLSFDQLNLFESNLPEHHNIRGKKYYK